MKRLLFLAASALLLLGASPGVFAQAFPSRPIKLVIPYPAGGSSDVIARLVAEPMAKVLGQPVIVENKPGAAGQVASLLVAKAEPDGYTLLATNLGPAAVAPALYPKLPYHPLNDFVPVSLTGVMPLVVTVGGTSPYKTLGELVAAAKASPGKLNHATTGNGSLSHVVITLLNSTAGIQATAIPYKGGAEVATAAIGGDVDYFVGPPSDISSLVKAGRLRPIAITSAQRSSLMPGVPTVAEAGFAGFEVDYWNGIMAPARTPAAIVDKLNAAIGVALDNPEVKAKMAGIQVTPAHSTPAQFSALVRDEVAKWTKVVQANGIKGD